MQGTGRVRGANRLTALKVQKAKGPVILEDGNGLRLIVEEKGNRRWACRITIAGKRANRGLGTYPDVSLDEARRKAQDLRRAAREGRDAVARKSRSKVASS